MKIWVCQVIAPDDYLETRICAPSKEKARKFAYQIATDILGLTPLFIECRETRKID